MGFQNHKWAELFHFQFVPPRLFNLLPWHYYQKGKTNLPFQNYKTRQIFIFQFDFLILFSIKENPEKLLKKCRFDGYDAITTMIIRH